MAPPRTRAKDALLIYDLFGGRARDGMKSGWWWLQPITDDAVWGGEISQKHIYICNTRPDKRTYNAVTGGQRHVALVVTSDVTLVVALGALDVAPARPQVAPMPFDHHLRRYEIDDWSVVVEEEEEEERSRKRKKQLAVSVVDAQTEYFTRNARRAMRFYIYSLELHVNRVVGQFDVVVQSV